MNKIAQIALPIALNKEFSYRLPDMVMKNDIIGRRALVSLGKRIVTGVIVDVSESDAKNLKEIIELLDEEPVFSENMLKFTKWISDYYMASWGETLKAALPQGMSPKSLLQVNVLDFPDSDELLRLSKRAPKRYELLQMLEYQFEPFSVKYLEHRLKTESIAVQLETLEKQGYISCVRYTEEDIKPRTQKGIQIAPELFEDKKKLNDALKKLDKRSPKQSLLLSYLYLKYKETQVPSLLTEAIEEAKSTRHTANSLVKKSFAIICDIEIDRNAIRDRGDSLAEKNELLLSLTEEQEAAADAINNALESKLQKPYLMFGVTGSGKTLVYMQAIKKALDLGKTALLLVPEISLTPQLLDRFRNVFADDIASLHSRMSEGERYDAWRKIREGKVKVVLGARSALFSPLENLGLIIVDEEHENSYKQDSPAPRYHARDAAIVRANIDKAVVVLGSATPSLESMYNALNKKYKLLQILNRADGALLPKIHIVDTKQAAQVKMMDGSFSNVLIEAIADRIMKKEGVILFQNRRGFSTYLECPDCGHIPMCQFCDVTLTYHKARGQMRCHYCGYIEPAHKSCTVCGSVEMNERGAGTQRIETELEEILKNKGIEANIERMDLDTTTRRGSHRKLLYNFSKGYIDVLVGTQMVAKGLDFDRVTLVGVINADLQLHMPDFRASERTFQLITQVAGRAGRSAEKTGEVVIQSSRPDNHALIAALNGSYKDFYTNEIDSRISAEYPPFSRFVKVEFAGKNESKVHDCAKKYASLFPANQESIQVLGPNEPQISRIRSQYRRIVIIKNPKSIDKNGAKMRYIINKVNELYRKKFAISTVKMFIDIDSFSGV